ncbi:MAG: ComEC/Rec2 family competence protein [Muribaculaceae bacterium]|nr:ComEC/Rec2 family competence protein [Muribaculaceae bacterium]
MLSRIPLLRVLLPFAMGIVAARYQTSLVTAALILAIGIGIYIWFSVVSNRSTALKAKFRQRAYAPIFLIIFAIGNAHALLNVPTEINLNDLEGKTTVARVDDLKHTDHSTSIQATLLQAGDSNTAPVKVTLSTRGCDYTLAPGDLLAFDAHLKRITNRGNPYETDYTLILRNNGFLYTQHLPLNELHKVGHTETFMNKVTLARNRVEDVIIHSSLDPDTQAFLMALLLGNASHIDSETRHAYSCAGVAHILALSGLHMGIFTLIIWMLLYPLDYLRLKKLRYAITLIALLAFAVFTGLSASVVRATIMTAFVFTAYIFFRKSSPLNALAASAILILLINPTAWMNAGFQLSFITVAAIIIFAPTPTAKDRKRNPMIAYARSTLIISAIAMLSTVVLTAHYFHTISLASIISNLLVLPLLTVLMAGGVIFFFLGIAGIDSQLLNSLLDGLFHLIDNIVNAINGTGISHIDNIYVTWLDVLLYYAIIVLAAIALKVKSWKPAIAAGAVLAGAIFVQAINRYQLPKHGVVVLNDYSSTPVFFFENSQGYLWVPDKDEVDLKKFKHIYAGLLAHQHIDSIQVVDSCGIDLPWAYVKPPFASIAGNRFTAITNKRNIAFSATQFPTTDFALITKRCHATASEVQERYPDAMLLLSGDMYEPDHDTFSAECDSCHIPYHSVKKDGAWSRFH